MTDRATTATPDRQPALLALTLIVLSWALALAAGRVTTGGTYAAAFVLGVLATAAAPGVALAAWRARSSPLALAALALSLLMPTVWLLGVFSSAFYGSG